MSAPAGEEAHRRFLNDYYGRFHAVYDLTRKYYLFGRDRMIRELASEPWKSLVEVGCGTGRNLDLIRKRRPDARLGGLDASDVMVSHAQQACPWAKVGFGFAEKADFAALAGGPPDRILFSYSLSMIEGREAALQHARRSIAPGGQVAVVDFGDLSTSPRFFRDRFIRFLNEYHVYPLQEPLLKAASSVQYGPGRYFVLARFGHLAG